MEHPFRSVLEDEKRLEALSEIGIMETVPELQFDILAEQAALLMQAPICTISFFDKEREWIKSSLGSNVSYISAHNSFASLTLSGDKICSIPNIGSDGRISNNPILSENPDINSFIGISIMTTEAHRIGALSFFYCEHKKLEKRLISHLNDMSKSVEKLIDESVYIDEVSDLRFGIH